MYLLLVIYIYASYYFPTPRAAEDEGARPNTTWRRVAVGKKTDRLFDILCMNKFDS